MRTKLLLISLLISISLLTSCSFLLDNGNEDMEQLQEQVSMLATQNASLQDQLSASEDEELDVPLPPEGNNQNQISLSTPTEEFLPVDPVPAGVPIVYDGWSMIVSKELVISSDGESWGIEIYIKNLGDTDRIFRYTNAGITLKDDLGNIYERIDDNACGPGSCEAYRYEVKNLEVEAEDSHTIHTFSLHCYACDYNDGLDWWHGPISLQASQIIVLIEDFGPFDGVEVVIDL